MNFTDRMKRDKKTIFISLYEYDKYLNLYQGYNLNKKYHIRFEVFKRKLTHVKLFINYRRNNFFKIPIINENDEHIYIDASVFYEILLNNFDMELNYFKKVENLYIVTLRQKKLDEIFKESIFDALFIYDD